MFMNGWMDGLDRMINLKHNIKVSFLLKPHESVVNVAIPGRAGPGGGMRILYNTFITFWMY